jgi:hypothetical protein
MIALDEEHDDDWEMGQSVHDAQRCHERIVTDVFNITNYVDTKRIGTRKRMKKLFALFMSCIISENVMPGEVKVEST